MITYSTNWMGPISLEWYKKRGIHETYEVYAGGRIDIRGLDCNEYYDGRHEYALPVMNGESWNKLSDWLEQLETDELISYEQLVEMFEVEHGKIVWASDVFKIDNK